ncbi:MAG: hypothetical protein K9G62_06165 [Alphaproteobacteria bacterium]|nr:hypothetical protein [Alphaproteobacteria bacterium]
MKKVQHTLFWTIILSETSHVFCCVLPTLFSVLSLLAGMGIIGVMPVWLQDVHEALHEWELPLIAASGAVLVLGWALESYSRKIDCHDTGCHHGPCGDKKKASIFVLKIATLLFLVNVAVYGVFHRGMGIFGPSESEFHADEDHAFKDQ